MELVFLSSLQKRPFLGTLFNDLDLCRESVKDVSRNPFLYQRIKIELNNEFWGKPKC